MGPCKPRDWLNKNPEFGPVAEDDVLVSVLDNVESSALCSVNKLRLGRETPNGVLLPPDYSSFSGLV
jgi:hypothetical protein